jgi:hypothetical protein
LLANIGGSLGLCMGMSMLSFCELLEVFAEFMFIVGRNWIDKKGVNKNLKNGILEPLK